MKLQSRFWMLPAVSALLFALSLATMHRLSTGTQASLQEVGEVGLPNLVSLLRAQALSEAYFATARRVAAGDDTAKLDEHALPYAALSEALRQLPQPAERASNLALLRRSLTDYNLNSVHAATVAHGQAGSDKPRMVSALALMQQNFEHLLAAEIGCARADMEARLLRASDGLSHMKWAMVLCAAAVLTALCLGTTVLLRSLWRDIGCEPAEAQRILSAMTGGDLTQPGRWHPGADNSLVARLDGHRCNLQRLFASIRDHTEAISVSAHDAAAASQEMSNRTMDTLANLKQTTASIAQLTIAADMAAHASSMAKQLADSAAGVASKGGDAMTRAVATMTDIHHASQRVVEITDVIDRIASQTNILALNAAAEAARAGAHGVGFAAVAHEVRTLAQRCSVAARDIHTLINASAERVQVGALLVDEAGSNVTEVVASVEQVGAIVADICATASDQSNGIAQLEQAVHHLESLNLRSAAVVAQATDAAASVHQQTVALNALIGHFTVSGGNAELAR